LTDPPPFFAETLSALAMRWVHRSIGIDPGTPADLPRIAAILEGIATCRLISPTHRLLLVALAERQNLSRVASFDRDCAVYRALGKRAFTNVFFGD
jgi:hypothetical protein